jgi:hypothetical protein
MGSGARAHGSQPCSRESPGHPRLHYEGLRLWPASPGRAQANPACSGCKIPVRISDGVVRRLKENAAVERREAQGRSQRPPALSQRGGAYPQGSPPGGLATRQRLTALRSLTFFGELQMGRKSKTRGAPLPRERERVSAVWQVNRKTSPAPSLTKGRTGAIIRVHWFFGESRRGKREHGRCAFAVRRGCPRNCKRRALSAKPLGNREGEDERQRPASQETCQRSHPTGGRGVHTERSFAAVTSMPVRRP